MSKDFVGNDLKVGDTVAIVEPYYHNLVFGVVKKCTPKGATVNYKLGDGYEKTTSRSSNSIIKVIK